MVKRTSIAHVPTNTVWVIRAHLRTAEPRRILVKAGMYFRAFGWQVRHTHSAKQWDIVVLRCTARILGRRFVLEISLSIPATNASPAPRLSMALTAKPATQPLAARRGYNKRRHPVLQYTETLTRAYFRHRRPETGSPVQTPILVCRVSLGHHLPDGLAAISRIVP